ncbi:PIG-L deacetylase family protein [Kitasatospora purpeofusca]|uniref:PIG-L deacetylase family protein n=1 Tax=Kitasatospora purpeofusca TaxID=67352 RepID=UPI00068CE6BF|nr:PIG-L family deacetylase [Kitasatospora purpeofusca]
MTHRQAQPLSARGPRAVPADPIQEPGTPEQAWESWSGLKGLPTVDALAVLPARPDRRPRVLVVAAHPDDEVLGFGGTLAVLAASGVRVRLVSVTAGEASHPHSRASVARNLAAVRNRELHEALARLGAADVQRVALAVPDGEVARHEREVSGRLTELLRDCDLCVAPYSHDRHPDHEAAGRAALAAGASRGVAVWEYPVWAWHWAVPGDGRLPWHRAVRLPLPFAAQDRKRAALACFRSQIEPLGDRPEDAAILPPAELAHFRRDFEVIWR